MEGSLEEEHSVNDDYNRILVQSYSLLRPVGFRGGGWEFGGTMG